MDLQEDLNAAALSLDRAAESYHGKIGEIDATVALKSAEVDAKKAEIDAKIAAVDPQLFNHPNIRLTANQIGNLDGNGDLDGWGKNGALNVSISLVETIGNSANFAGRSQLAQDVLTAMGKGAGSADPYTRPDIKVIQIDWTGGTEGVPIWLIGPGETIYASPAPLSFGCYGKVISGAVSSWMFKGMGAAWSQCGFATSTYSRPGQYVNPNPHALTETGSIQIVWPGAVWGEVNFAAPTPQWSYFPHSKNGFDTNA